MAPFKPTRLKKTSQVVGAEEGVAPVHQQVVLLSICGHYNIEQMFLSRIKSGGLFHAFKWWSMITIVPMCLAVAFSPQRPKPN